MNYDVRQSIESAGLGPAFARDAAGTWVVLHTKSRQEKALFQDLTAQSIRCFLPLVQSPKFHGKRRVWVEEPLFPGYVFLKGTMEQAYLADRTRRVANILTVTDQIGLDYDLRGFAMALSKKGEFNPYPFLQKGIRVEVKSGPFRGLRGYIEDPTRCDRIVLSVNLLSKSASLDIHGALLSPV
jgi:transcription antitermination factor NusG